MSSICPRFIYEGLSAFTDSFDALEAKWSAIRILLPERYRPDEMHVGIYLLGPNTGFTSNPFLPSRTAFNCDTSAQVEVEV